MSELFHIYYIRIASIPNGRIGSSAVRLSAQFNYMKLMKGDSQEDSSQADTG